MTSRTGRPRTTDDPFAAVAAVGLALPGVERAVRYDGCPVLQVGGAFMAGLTAHPSAEPGTLVVRVRLDDREALLADAPDTYYLTEYHAPHPVVLVRLRRLDRPALHDLLGMARRATLPKARRGRARAAD
jgi:hypothetical protein